MLLTLEGITKRFGGLTAVDNLSISIKKDQIYGIIGPNGAGKTTVFNCITGVYKPEKGKIIFNGKNITGLSAHTIANLGIVRTFQTIRLFGKMSVAENIMSGRHFISKQHWWHGIIHTPFSAADEKVNWMKVKEYLELFDLMPYAKMPASSQPYGIQRKIDKERMELVRTINEIKKMVNYSFTQSMKRSHYVAHPLFLQFC